MNIKSIIVLASLICNACTEHKSTAIDSFDVVEKIVDYDRVYSDKNDPLGEITYLRIVDDVLITKHIKDEYNFSFIDVNDGTMLRRWGTKGEAPDEFINFGSEFTISDSRLVFMNRMKKEINYVSISEILEDAAVLNVHKAPYPYTVNFRPTKMDMVKNKKIFLGAFKEGRFGVIDSTNTMVDCPAEYPFECGEVTGIYRGNVFQGCIEANNKQGKFVIATYSSDIFEIYEVTDSAIQRLYVNKFCNAPKVRKKGGQYVIDFNKSIVGLKNMAVSDDLICFTYSSALESEANQSDKSSNEILCFDWNGKKIKKIILPISVNKFCMDDQYIYGVKYDEDETAIYRFKFQ